MNPRLRTTAWLAAAAACAGACLPARAAIHPKLDEALEVMAKAEEMPAESDAGKSQLEALLTQAETLIQTEAPGPEWQGHRAAAVDLLEKGLRHLGKNFSLVIARDKIRFAIAETHLAIQAADEYQPISILCGPGSASVAPVSDGSDSIKLSFLPESSAQPVPSGTTLSNMQVPDPNDPNEVIHGKAAYFSLKSGKTILYSVESGKPVTKLTYTGKPFNATTIQIKDPQGKSITGIGPFDGGNVQTREMAVPGLTHFQVAITSYDGSWILIESLRFESNGVALTSPALPVAPAADSGPSNPPAPAVVTNKLTADQERAVVLISGDNAEGTGFLIRTPDGPAVVTNIHVIANNPNLKITTNSGALVKVLSMKGASDRDLALLAIQDAGYSYLQLAPDVSAVVQPGDDVVTPGNSEGGEVMLNTDGRVLGIGPERIEFDNPIYHGNSGGPVFHTKSGKVLGVVTEAQKVDLTDALDKASFANRSSAISGSMRYFGLRLDTVPAWLAIDPRRFQTESAFLDNFDDRNKALDSYLNAPADDKPEDNLWRKDDKIVQANDEFYQQAGGADISQRMDADRIMWSEFNDIAAMDMDAIQNPNNFYSFDLARARDAAAYRKAIQKELDDINSNVSRLGSLPRSNNQ